MAIIGYRSLRDPWLEMERLQAEMDRALGLAPRPERTRGILPLRVTEDAESVLVEAPLPGVDPAKVELTVTGDTLALRGQRPRHEEEGIVREHRLERWAGPFVRSLSVPGGIDAEGVSAEYRNGLLRVRLPRRREALPRKIEVRAETR